jgi:hypothetical protein
VQGRLLTKQPALRRLRHLCSACHSPRASPWTPAACGDLGRRPTLPNPQGAFSPRKGGFAHPFHPHSQGRRSPLPLHPLAACPSGTKEGTSPLWTLQGKDNSPSVPAPSQASGAVLECVESQVSRPAQSRPSFTDQLAAARPFVPAVRCRRKVRTQADSQLAGLRGASAGRGGLK